MMHSERMAKWKRWSVGLSLFGVAVFGSGAYDLARLSLLQRRLDRRMVALSAQQERLTREQERLTSDPTYVEGVIRSTFKVAYPGEIVIPLAAVAAPSSRERSHPR